MIMNDRMIDEISYRMLKILQEKARIPNVEMARQVDLAPSAVLERVRKLEKSGIIQGYEVRLNPEYFGRSLVAFVVVKVACDAQPGDAFARIPDVLEVHFVSGEDGYLLKVRVRDAAELGRVIRERISAVPGVMSTRTSAVLNTFKETTQIPLP